MASNEATVLLKHLARHVAGAIHHRWIAVIVAGFRGCEGRAIGFGTCDAVFAAATAAVRTTAMIIEFMRLDLGCLQTFTVGIRGDDLLVRDNTAIVGMTMSDVTRMESLGRIRRIECSGWRQIADIGTV